MILFVNKSELKPGQFGVCIGYGCDAVIKVRNDLPRMAEKALIAHESYHAQDQEKNALKREIGANWAMIKKYPVGSLTLLAMSLFNLERWGYYLKRIRDGK